MIENGHFLVQGVYLVVLDAQLFLDRVDIRALALLDGFNSDKTARVLYHVAENAGTDGHTNA